MLICTECGHAELDPMPRAAPTAEELEALLLAEYIEAKKEDKAQRGYRGRVLTYQRESALRADLRLEMNLDQWFSLEAGDDVVALFGNEQRAGVITDLVERTLYARVEPFSEDLDADSEVAVKRAPTANIAQNHLEFFRNAASTEASLFSLLNPEALPQIAGVTASVPSRLNEEQGDAYRHALGIEEDGVGLILGPPGTGKTTVIAHLVDHLISTGHTVLVTAHTHVAIDNVLIQALRLNSALGPKLARLGRSIKIHPALEPYYFTSDHFRAREDMDDATRSRTTVARIFQEYPLVGLTLDNLIGRLSRAKTVDVDKFDYVIVDEASMNLLPKTAAAAAAGWRLLLVGDHFQLPPIIPIARFAKDPRYSRSLFEHIATKRPDLVRRLTKQYRSVPGIMTWSSATFYARGLADMRTSQVGKAAILGRTLGAVTWVDTGSLPNAEHLARRPQSGGTPSFGNPQHLAVAVHVVQELIKAGVPASDIGYIAPYRLQSAAFHKLAYHHLPSGAGFQITSSTVDAFQGSERRVIIYDLTTTTPQKSHASPNRLNVSLTRAKDHLVLIGDKRFARTPDDEPAHWSLQKRLRTEVILASSLALSPSLLADADRAVRYGEAARPTKTTSLEDLLDRPEFTPDHYDMLASAFAKKSEESLCIAKILKIVQEVAPSTNVRALYDELRAMPMLPGDRNRDLKTALRATKSILHKPQPGAPMRLQLLPRKVQIEAALKANTPKSAYLEMQVERALKAMREHGV